MDILWTVFVRKNGTPGETALATFRRPVDEATVGDFGLSIAESRKLLIALQHQVAQDQIVAYDLHRRHCQHCGAYRRIKDWRPRSIATGLGPIHVKAPRIEPCGCGAEPPDMRSDCLPRAARSPFPDLLRRQRTPEVSYLCAKHGASSSYRSAARTVADMTGLEGLSHASVRKETILCGQHVEGEQLMIGARAGRSKREGAKHLRVSIDGTVLTAASTEQVTRFEVVAGRVECDGHMGKRFVCALARRDLTRTLVAAALDQSGWIPSTDVDVVTDGARGMRALVTSVAPRVAPKILDWFHMGMKLQAVKRPLCAVTFPCSTRPELMLQCERSWRGMREALWRGRGEEAIELLRILRANLTHGMKDLPPFYASCAATARGAATALQSFLQNNRRDLIDYQRARMAGRRISSASAESVMNHVVNRRLSKRQQMRWSMHGAHYLLQTRVELLDETLERRFEAWFPHFRTPELRRR